MKARRAVFRAQRQIESVHADPTSKEFFAPCPGGVSCKSEPRGPVILKSPGESDENGTCCDCGTVFQINTDGSDFKLLTQFTGNSDGKFPRAGLLLSGTTLYGTTEQGGNLDAGVVFSLSIGPPPPPVVVSPLISNGLFSFQVAGDPSQTVVIEASTNLTDWIPVSTNVLGFEPLPWSDLQGVQFSQRFYRVRSP